MRQARLSARKERRLSQIEAASLGVAYLAGEPLPALLKRFGLKNQRALLDRIGKLARKQWRAHRRARIGCDEGRAA